MKLAIFALLVASLSANAAPAAADSLQAKDSSTALSNTPFGMQMDGSASLNHRLHRRDSDSEDESSRPTRRQPDFGDYHYQPPRREHEYPQDHFYDHQHGYIAQDAVDRLFGSSHPPPTHHGAYGGGYYAPPQPGYQHAQPHPGHYPPPHAGYQYAPPHPGHYPPTQPGYPAGYHQAPAETGDVVWGIPVAVGHPVPQEHATQPESSYRPSTPPDSPAASDNESDSPPSSPPTTYCPPGPDCDRHRRRRMLGKLNPFKKNRG